MNKGKEELMNIFNKFVRINEQATNMAPGFTDNELSDINKGTGIEFTKDSSDELFDRNAPEPVQKESSPMPVLNLGVYDKVFKVTHKNRTKNGGFKYYVDFTNKSYIDTDVFRKIKELNSDLKKTIIIFTYKGTEVPSKTLTINEGKVSKRTIVLTEGQLKRLVMEDLEYNKTNTKGPEDNKFEVDECGDEPLDIIGDKELNLKKKARKIKITETQLKRLMNEQSIDMVNDKADILDVSGGDKNEDTYLSGRKALAEKMNSLMEKNNVHEISINSEIPANEWASVIDNDNEDFFNAYIDELQKSSNRQVDFNKLVQEGDGLKIDGKEYLISNTALDNPTFIEEYVSDLQPDVVSFYHMHLAPDTDQSPKEVGVSKDDLPNTDDNTGEEDPMDAPREELNHMFGADDHKEEGLKYDNMDGNRKFGSDYNKNSGGGYEDDRNLDESVLKIRDSFNRFL